MASVRLRDVTVDFPIRGADRSLRRSLLAPGSVGSFHRSGQDGAMVVRALDAVRLDIWEGECVGLVGPNGAGKSTLLRTIAGIYEPVSGTVITTGTISTLFSLGLGMNPLETGWESIRAMGLLHGMSRDEIARKAGEIARVSELGDFIHLPVRTYSTGMRLRLAFSVATAIDPQILLLDEGLGAGDAAFAEKARARMDALLERASTIVLATHSESLIRSLCSRAVYLDGGRVQSVGGVDEVLDLYRLRRANAAPAPA